MKRKGKVRRKPKPSAMERDLEKDFVLGGALLVASKALRLFLPELNNRVSGEVCMCGLPGGCRHPRRQP
jgi:hypothetical protein